MLLESLLPVAIVVFTLTMLLILLYYTVIAPQSKTSEARRSLWNHHLGNHHPVLDDDMAYLAASLYPRSEYVHFPGLPLTFDRHDVTQPA